MIRRLVCSRQAHRHTAHLPDHFSCDFQSGRTAIDAEHTSRKVRRALAAEGLHRVDRSGRRALGQRPKRGGVQRAAGVEHDLSAPFIAAKMRQSGHSAMALSGVAISTTSEASTWRVSRSVGCPAPMTRTAARAVVSASVTTPMRHPSSCKRRPSDLPTRPAPTMDNVSDICCVSISCPAIFALAENSNLHIFWIAVFGLIASLWVIQGIRASVGMARLPWLSDALHCLPGCAVHFGDFCRAG